MQALGIRVLGLCEDVFVEGLDGVFKGGELDHGVGDLSHPQRGDTLVEAVHSLVGLDHVEALSEIGSEVVGSLHSYFQLNIGINN